jgi:hypothetical protein
MWQRPFGIAGDWHTVPRRVRAPQRSAARAIHRDGSLGFHQRHEMRAILAAVERLGWTPSINPDFLGGTRFDPQEP